MLLILLHCGAVLGGAIAGVCAGVLLEILLGKLIEWIWPEPKRTCPITGVKL